MSIHFSQEKIQYEHPNALRNFKILPITPLDIGFRMLYLRSVLVKGFISYALYGGKIAKAGSSVEGLRLLSRQQT